MSKFNEAINAIENRKCENGHRVLYQNELQALIDCAELVWRAGNDRNFKDWSVSAAYCIKAVGACSDE